MNNSLKEIGEVLLGASSVLLFPHVNADGDALGSCVALTIALRRCGVKCSILIEDKVADNLAFIDKATDGDNPADAADSDNLDAAVAGATYTTLDGYIYGEYPDICIAVDNGEPDRFPKRKEVFERGKIKICLDHHPTSHPFADYNYIDPKAAATGEIIYDLCNAMNIDIDEKMGTALFTAITTDCGNFQYSNTTRRTFEIAMNLMDSGFNLCDTSNAIYQNNPPERIKLETEILSTMQIFAEGRAAISYVTQDMLMKTGARMEDTGGIINVLRGIRGVEVAILLKENESGAVKASMRSKSYADVSAVCQRHGGGGHIRAAGCTLDMTVSDATKLIVKEITEIL